MRRVPVSLGERSYDVLIAPGLVREAARHVAPLAFGDRLAIVSDEQVWAAQGQGLRAGLGALASDPILVPAGERSKDWATLAGLIDRLAHLNLERGEPVLAFGGGMVGDLAGLAAALYKRGCPLIQVPSSLLAQVDSSVGGKTAINIAAGKNLAGAFHQPSLVLIDLDMLGTLPERELRAGYAEIVKIGLIQDPAFFAWCETNSDRLLSGETEAQLHAIATCVQAKAAIVAEDERETGGRRALLNLGHTFGHAIEAVAGYSGDILHGEAVAVGMALAFRLSAERGLCHLVDAERVVDHLRAAGLPTSTDLPPRQLVDAMASDKKNAGGALTLILAEGIGRARIVPDIAPEEVEAFLSRR